MASSKRKDYISWDEYFMGVASLAALRSKDPNTQVGACIVSDDNKILSMGYNGLPVGCSDDEFPWNRESDDPYDNKYFYTTHSELNAILNYRLCFLVMSAPRPLFSVALRRLYMAMINMEIHLL